MPEYGAGKANSGFSRRPFAQAPVARRSAAVPASPGDKNGRVLVAARVGENIFIDDMRFRVD